MTAYSLKTITASLLLGSLLAFSPAALALDSFIVVKITDMDKKVEHRIMSAEEYKALETEIKAEASLFPKAEEQAKKEWKANEENKSIPFPTGLNPRKLEVIERSTSQEKADAKLEKLEDAESRRAMEPKKAGKQTETDKKRADAKADREEALQKGQDLVKAKLTELTSKDPKEDKPKDKPEADKKN